jgi:hypothetical protein
MAKKFHLGWFMNFIPPRVGYGLGFAGRREVGQRPVLRRHGAEHGAGGF